MQNDAITLGPHPRSDQVVCTLFEGHYHFGVGALFNSLVTGGFRGLLWAGYRGTLPPWTNQLTEVGEQLFQLPNGAQIKFEKLDIEVHFTNYKPDLMLDLIRRGVATKLLWYFDPDITVQCSWGFLLRWAKRGVSICSEITNGYMPEKHPVRCMWEDAARDAGWGPPVTAQTRYYNAGFIGLDIAYASFLKRWKFAIEIATQTGVDLKDFMLGTREDAYFCVDQDSLNLTTMYATEPISAIGPEGMGFIHGGFTMFHMVGSPKPWNKKYFLSALRGIPPGRGDKHFLASAKAPIRLYSPGKLRLMRLDASAGALIGRFYSRR
jgi:hypothetical protein